MKKREPLAAASRRANKLGFGANQRTLLMCVDRKAADCCSAAQMIASWKHLCRRLKEMGYRKQDPLRIKTRCIDICKAGPILGILPDQVWYGRCTPEVIDEILQSHLVEGRVLEDYIIAAPDGIEQA